ncbi:MAG: zinc-binding dehydrogenase [Anaerolineales bacterium]
MDYTKEDFTKNGKQYDLILAANGYHSLSDYKRALAPQGKYVMAGGKTAQLFQALLFGSWMSKNGGKKMGIVSAKPDQQDLAYMKELFESGKVRSVIDKCYPLHEAVDAMQYLGTGHARGKIIVTM